MDDLAGSPRFSLLSCCRALSVFEHQNFSALWLGTSCFSLMNLPFESIKMTTYAFWGTFSLSWWDSVASACVVTGAAVVGVLDLGVRVWAAAVWVAGELGCCLQVCVRLSVCSLRLCISLSLRSSSFLTVFSSLPRVWSLSPPHLHHFYCVLFILFYYCICTDQFLS